MRSYSIFLFTFMILSELILAYPDISRVKSRSESIDQLNPDLPLAKSIEAPASQIRKRYLWRGARKDVSGFKCDSTFYKQTRVEAIATKACQREKAEQIKEAATGFTGRFRGAFSRMFTPFPRAYSGAYDLFPGMSNLRMIRITRSFFALNQVMTFLRISKRDYVVFSDCTAVGIVREKAKNSFIRCTSVQPNVPPTNPSAENNANPNQPPAA